MELFTNKPIAFLLNFSAGNLAPNNRKGSFTVISINNKNLSFVGVVFVALKRQQKRIGLLFSKNTIKNISQYILVGRDKSVVTISKVVIPTIPNLQGCCG